jgi:hypothetical protein
VNERLDNVMSWSSFDPIAIPERSAQLGGVAVEQHLRPGRVLVQDAAGPR